MQMLNQTKLVSEENFVWFPKAIKAHYGLSKTWAPEGSKFLESQKIYQVHETDTIEDLNDTLRQAATKSGKDTKQSQIENDEDLDWYITELEELKKLRRQVTAKDDDANLEDARYVRIYASKKILQLRRMVPNRREEIHTIRVAEAHGWNRSSDHKDVQPHSVLNNDCTKENDEKMAEYL